MRTFEKVLLPFVMTSNTVISRLEKMQHVAQHVSGPRVL